MCSEKGKTGEKVVSPPRGPARLCPSRSATLIAPLALLRTRSFDLFTLTYPRGNTVYPSAKK